MTQSYSRKYLALAVLVASGLGANSALAQLEETPDVPTSAGPVVGPLREIRAAVATAVAATLDGADAQAALDQAAQQSNNLIADYNARNA